MRHLTLFDLVVIGVAGTIGTGVFAIVGLIGSSCKLVDWLARLTVSCTSIGMIGRGQGIICDRMLCAIAAFCVSVDLCACSELV